MHKFYIKTALVLLFLFLFTGTSFSGAFAAENGEDAILTTEGQIIKIRIEPSSSTIFIKKADGRTVELTAIPYRDWTSEEIARGIPEKKNKIYGTDTPQLTDKFCTVKAWYLPGKENILLKYQVQKRPSSFWLVIAFSSKDPQETQTQKYAALAQGFETDVIESFRFPALKAGYWVLGVGAATDRKSALYVMETARKKGWKDAYIRKLW